MCGFVGIVGSVETDGHLHRMLMDGLACLSHRGPDGTGTFFDPDLPLAFGHQRLAIIDPEHGHQPMHSGNGNFTIIFNGAIYNYLELRRELISLGHPIRTYTDTEVLLYAYVQWGENCLDRLLGMFAFAIFDKRTQTIFCARDRLGIKPFYYAATCDVLVFASEAKAILATGLIQPKTDSRALSDYLSLQFGIGEKTLFKGISKLQPGHFLIARLASGKLEVSIRQYWDIQYDIDREHEESWFVDHLAGLIEDSVRLHLRSDVPLGAHLSGGLDSSAVVCVAASLLKGEKLKTFTGAFHEGPEFDETPYAKQVAAFANTDYYETYIDGSSLAEVLPKLIYFMDEPVAGPGLIPQYFVAKQASDHVKVVLGGQGGDELFIGYARYLMLYLERCLSGAIFEPYQTPAHAVTLTSIIQNLPLLKGYTPMLQDLWRSGLFKSPDQRYFTLLNRGDSLSHVISPDVYDTRYSTFESFAEVFNRPGETSLINQMTYFDLKESLPALLHVEDRTSMAVSLESRVPLLDHRIVEFMARIPPNIKFAAGRAKHLLKEAAKHNVPEVILQRTDKMGFPTPMAQWTKGVANDFVKDILLSRQAKERGLFKTDDLEKSIKNENVFGRSVWGLLCLELWHRIYIDKDINIGG